MKISKSQLMQIIKEEVSSALHATLKEGKSVQGSFTPHMLRETITTLTSQYGVTLTEEEISAIEEGFLDKMKARGASWGSGIKDLGGRLKKAWKGQEFSQADTPKKRKKKAKTASLINSKIGKFKSIMDDTIQDMKDLSLTGSDPNVKATKKAMRDLMTALRGVSQQMQETKEGDLVKDPLVKGERGYSAYGERGASPGREEVDDAEDLFEEKEGKGCAESEGGSGCIKKDDKGWFIWNNKKGGIFKRCKSKKDCEEILEVPGVHRG